MDKWLTKRIDQLGRVVTGKTPVSERPQEFGHHYPFITPSDIPGTQKYVCTERFLSAEGADRHRKISLPPKSTCVVCIGATIGKVCTTDKESFTNQQINSIVPFASETDADFLFYISTQLRDVLVAYSGGAATPIVNKSSFSAIRLKIPPLHIQKKIGFILSAYDDLIENNKRRIAILEKMAEEIYREWFVRMRFSSYAKATEDKPAVGKSKGLPSGWAIQRLDSFCAKVTDGTHDTPKPQIEGVPLVTGKNLHNGRVDFADTYKISEQDHLSISKRSGLTPFDILFSNIGTLGAMAVVTADINYSVKNVIIFKSKSPAHALYLYWTLRQQYHVDLMQAISSGASQQFISLGVARGYKIISPAPEILESFGRLILPVHEMIQSLYDSMEKLTSIRDLLLPRLISGKLPVENLELPSNEKLASASSALPQQGLAHA